MVQLYRKALLFYSGYDGDYSNTEYISDLINSYSHTFLTVYLAFYYI